MAIYIDNVQIPHIGKLWCHMVADSLVELHTFAQLLNIPKRGFHVNASYPHYDITVELREKALTLGALIGTRKEIIRCAKLLKAELDTRSPSVKCKELT